MSLCTFHLLQNLECDKPVQDQNSKHALKRHLCGTCAESDKTLLTLADPAEASLVNRAAGLTGKACKDDESLRAFKLLRAMERDVLDPIFANLQFSKRTAWFKVAWSSGRKEETLYPISQLKFTGKDGQLRVTKEVRRVSDMKEEHVAELHSCIQRLDEELVGRSKDTLQKLEACLLTREKAVCAWQRHDHIFPRAFPTVLKTPSAGCELDFDGLLERIIINQGDSLFAPLRVVKDEGIYVDIDKLGTHLGTKEAGGVLVPGYWLMRNDDATRVFESVYGLVFNRDGTVFDFPSSNEERTAFVMEMGDETAVSMLGAKWEGEWTYCFAAALRKYIISECFQIDGSRFFIETLGGQVGNNRRKSHACSRRPYHDPNSA